MKLPKQVYVIVVATLVVCASAQELKPQAPHPLPLITEEKTSTPALTEAQNLKLRAAQVELLQSAAALTPLQDAANKQLAATKEAQRFAAAKTAIDATVLAVYKELGVKPEEYQICDGPGDGTVCKGVPERTLALRPAPKVKK